MNDYDCISEEESGFTWARFVVWVIVLLGAVAILAFGALVLWLIGLVL